MTTRMVKTCGQPVGRHQPSARPPSVAEPYREQIEASLRQELTAQRIYQDLCEQEAYSHAYASVRR
jgi:hypothetical protein